MSITYNITTNFGAKDSLNTGDSNKVVRGSEFTTEFTAIKTALALAAPAASPTFTGTLTFGSISDGAITVTAFVDEDDMASNSATLIPTQQSVKAYVDSQLTAQDLDFQADSGGALSIDLDSETMTFAGGTGIDTSGSGNAVTFAIDSTVATLTGSQTLTNKTLTAPAISGNLTTNGTIDGRDVATDGAKLDAIEASADVTDTANVTAAGALMDSELTSEASVKALNQGVATSDSPTFAGLTTTANVSFGDNDKAVFGAGNDLQIYHDSTDSYIQDAGNGNLRFKTNGTAVQFEKADGNVLGVFSATANGVELYKNNIKRFETTSTGIDVTGTVTADGLTVDGSATINSAAPVLSLTETDTTNLNTLIENSSGNLNISTRSDDGGTKTKRIRVTHSTGDVSFYENTGTTPKMFWDSSAESLGIGTTSPANQLDVVSSSNATARLEGGANGNASLKLTESGNSGFELKYDGANNNFNVGGGTSGSFTTYMTIHRGTGNVGIGTDSPGANLQIHDTNSAKLWITADGSNPTNAGSLRFAETQLGGNYFEFLHNGSANTLALSSSNGDIVTFDRVNKRVGIGITTPDKALVVAGVGAEIVINDTDTTDNPTLRFRESGTTSGSISTDASALRFNTGSTEAMRLDSGGKLLLGVTSALSNNTKFQVLGNGITVSDNVTNANAKNSRYFGVSHANQEATMTYLSATSTNNTLVVGGGTSLAEPASIIKFHTGNTGTKGAGTERMRIALGGTVMVGKTQSNSATVGVELRQNGTMITTASGTAPFVVNRTTSDGNVAEFRKDGNAIGNIGAFAGEMTIGTGDNKLRFFDANSAISPCVDAGTVNDNAIDLGVFNSRFKNLHLSGSAYTNGLLVGKTSTDTMNTVGAEVQADGQIKLAADGKYPLQLNRLTSDGEIINIRKDGTTIGGVGVNSSNAYFASSEFGIKPTSVGLVSTNTSGVAQDGAEDLGGSNFRWRNLYLSGGAYLGGTATANKLDDYEEGTWTPEVADASTGGNTASIASSSGFYTKVGNIVHLTIRAINITTTGMTSGNDVFIRGLPFTLNGTANAMGAIQISEISFDGSPVLYGSGGTLIAKIGESASGSVVDFVTVGQLTSGNADIQATLTYRIA